MQTNIVYVITSDNSDFFLEKLAISVFSLRKYNPEASVTVLTDKQTNETLKGTRRIIFDYIDDLKIVDTPPDATKQMRSRIIKTNVRELIEGDFLFIDVDTVICGPLSEIDTCPFEIALWPEGNVCKNKNIFAYNIMKKLEWEHPLENEPYFNSGVMYVKDTNNTHSFYKEWYAQFLHCASKQVFRDQEALCMANKMKNHPIKPLDTKWNYTVYSKKGHEMSCALIIHYFQVSNSNYCLNRNSIFLSIKEFGINIPFIRDLIDNPQCFFVPAEANYFVHRLGNGTLANLLISNTVFTRTIRKFYSILKHIM